jgi:hypothetical protein
VTENKSLDKSLLITRSYKSYNNIFLSKGIGSFERDFACHEKLQKLAWAKMNCDKRIKRKEKKRVQFVKRAKRSGRIGENSLHF